MNENGAGTAVAVRDVEAVPAAPFGGSGAAFDTAQRIAKAIASSSIVPKDYQGNVPNVLVAMEYANRLGASLLAVIQNLDVIHGRPALRSKFLIGTVNATGRFSPIRYRWQGDEGTDSWGCRAYATDRESGEECVGPLITIGLAKAEGWYGKSGSKWKTIPELMLMYRAGAWWTNVYCPELSLGILTADEAVDIGPDREERIQSAAAALDAVDDEIPTVQGTPIQDAPASHDAQSGLDLGG